MGSNYLAPGNLLVFRGTCCIGIGSAAIYCFGFMWTTVFSLLSQGLIRTSFRCSYFILPLLYFVRTLLCIHIPQINMATYNGRVAIYHNHHGKDIDRIRRVCYCRQTHEVVLGIYIYKRTDC